MLQCRGSVGNFGRVSVDIPCWNNFGGQGSWRLVTLKGAAYMAEYSALCGILRRYRIAAGLSQAELALALKISQGTVSKIEAAVDRRLDLIEMKNYLRPLGKSLSDLAADLENELAQAN